MSAFIIFLHIYRKKNNIFFPGVVAEERQVKVFSPVHSKMKPDCELLKFPTEDEMLSFDCLASAGG